MQPSDPSRESSNYNAFGAVEVPERSGSSLTLLDRSNLELQGILLAGDRCLCLSLRHNCLEVDVVDLILEALMIEFFMSELIELFFSMG
jgi:hypothetical protein